MRIKNLQLRIMHSSFGGKLLIPSFLILTALFLLSSPVHAQALDLGQSRLHPASPLYFLKSVREALELKFAGTTNVRALRQLEFSTRRIREVKSLVKTSRQDLITPTLERYWWHIRELNGILTLTDENMVGKASDATTAQMNVLQTIYQQVTNPAAKRSIRTTVNRLSEWEQGVADKLNLLRQTSVARKLLISKLSGCNFLSKEASHSALNDVERVVLTERAKVCFLKSGTDLKGF